MISNERRWPAQPQPYRQPHYQSSLSPRPAVREDLLETREVQIERKHFTLLLKENPRGRFLRIVEEINGRQNCIIIPSTGLREFQKLFAEMLTANDAKPAPEPSAAG